MKTLTNSINTAIVLAGVALAFLSSFIDQAAEGYHLYAGFLFIGVLPYLIFAMAAYLSQGALSMTHGIALFVIHAWLVINVRMMGGSDEMLMTVPLLLAVLLLPLLIIALRKPYPVPAV